MAYIIVQLEVSDGHFCYRRGKLMRPCKFLSFGRCDIFDVDIKDMSGDYKKYAECLKGYISQKSDGT